MKSEMIPEKDVTVKFSVCGKCKGIVRVAVVHLMSKKDCNEFGKEVVDFNLSVKELPLLKYRKKKSNWCECNSKKE